METLEVNTKRELIQFAKEYGLVILGYSGRDRSVMDTLELLLKDEENYRHGVYWCILRGEQPSERLNSLLKRDRVYLVEIDGFDEFMAELHQTTNLPLPRLVSQPLEMAQARVRLITDVDAPLQSHAIIESHIREVRENINAARTRNPKIPLRLEATILQDMGHTDDAIIAWKQAHEENPSEEDIAYSYASALADDDRNIDLVQLIDKSNSSFNSCMQFSDLFFTESQRKRESHRMCDKLSR